MAGSSHDDYCLQEYKYLFQKDLLRGKVAFITGGASGIGFRIAELFMRHGCSTVIASRRMEKLQQSAKELSSCTGQACLPLQMDVRKYDNVLKAVKEAVKRFGKIDILVNSAAGNFLCPASSLSANGFKTVLEIDTMGTFNSSKAMYEECFKTSGGVIINISATLYYNGKVLQTHAGAAKAAIDAMTRHLAVEWGPQNIRINSIAPGPIEGTEGMSKLGGKALSDSNKETMLSLIPLQRLGTRTEIAESAVFLASPLSSFMTGSVMVVDGGEWLMGQVGGVAMLKSML